MYADDCKLWADDPPPEIPMDQFFFKPKDVEDAFTMLFSVRSGDMASVETHTQYDARREDRTARI